MHTEPALTIVVTGASSGIGAALACRLAREGHHVLATGRSPTKLAAVYERMVAAAPVGIDPPPPVVADLASLRAVRGLAATVLDRLPRLDVLVNNAGLQTPRRETSEDGYELVFAVNHLAPFLLTNLLLDRIRADGGRVVTTSSSSHTKGHIDFDDIQLERHWSGARSYGRSKLANILFAAELRRRHEVASTAAHPGGVTTDLNRASPFVRIVKPFERFILDSPEQGADTLAWLAVSKEGAMPSGLYYVGRKAVEPAAAARDPELAARLWEESERLVGGAADGGRA